MTPCRRQSSGEVTCLPAMGGRGRHRKWGGAQVSFAQGLGTPELNILSKLTEVISGRTGL